jgi:hypothetical protein
MDNALRAMLRARDKSVELIRTDPLDLQALDSELAKIRLSNMQAQESFHRVIHSAASKLNNNEREFLAHILRDSPPGRGGPMGALGPPGAPPWMDNGLPRPDDNGKHEFPEPVPAHPNESP